MPNTNKFFCEHTYVATYVPKTTKMSTINIYVATFNV